MKFVVEWSDEDNCYLGSLPHWAHKMKQPCCHGYPAVDVFVTLQCIERDLERSEFKETVAWRTRAITNGWKYCID